MSNVLRKLISIDLGFGHVKAVNEDGRTLTFPSVYNKLTKKALFGAVEDYVLDIVEDKNGEVAKRSFNVGCASQVEGAERRWDDKTSEFNQEQLEIYITTAIAGLVGKPGAYEIDLLLGLPISYFLSKQDSLKQALKGKKFKVFLNNSKAEYGITLKTVTVQPQGVGALNNELFNLTGNVKNQELHKDAVFLIDIGHRTVDYLYMKTLPSGKRINVATLTGSAEELGMNKSYQKIRDRILDETGFQVTEADLEWVALNPEKGYKMILRGQEIDLSNIFKEEYISHAKAISDRIKKLLDVEEQNVQHFLITGGGAMPLYEYMEDEFHGMRKCDECKFANARGYMALRNATIKK